jgi:hypothetical protein
MIAPDFTESNFVCAQIVVCVKIKKMIMLNSLCIVRRPKMAANGWQPYVVLV